MENLEHKGPSVRRIVVAPIAMAEWMVVADPCVLGSNQITAVDKFVAGEVGSSFGHAGHTK